MAERILEFEVNKQKLRKKRGCDFSYIVANSVGYLRAKFYFSSEWDGCVKIASFWKGDQEHAVPLDKNDSCYVHPEVLGEETFQVSVTCARPGYKIESTKTRVKQEVG